MDKLLIIDGNNLLFQMFYGMPSKIYNKNGETIHATIGFISYVLKQIKMFDITKCCVVFDCDCNESRKKLSKDYKANRNIDWDSLPKSDVPFYEEDKIVKCLNYLNIKVLFSKNMEADDLIASLTKLFEESTHIYISSFDSDFFQLINKNVSIIRCRGKNTVVFDEGLFYDKFGFTPDKYLLYKAIVGDSADNIMGVKSIGKKRGTELVKCYSSLDQIINDRSINKYKDLIIDNYDLVDRNIKLIKLDYINEIVYNIDYFCFDKDKTRLNNSNILSTCDIF